MHNSQWRSAQVDCKSRLTSHKFVGLVGDKYAHHIIAVGNYITLVEDKKKAERAWEISF
jgi:hypothetical protein